MPSGRKKRPRVIPLPTPTESEVPNLPPPAEVAASPDAVAAWNYVIEATARVGTFNTTDTATYQRYAMSAAQWISAARIVLRDGPVAVTKTGYTCTSGAFVVWTKLDRTLSAMETKLGLNPSGRESLHADKVVAEADPLGDFISRKA